MSDQVTCAHPGCADSDTPNIVWGGTRLCGLHLRTRNDRLWCVDCERFTDG